MHQGEFESSTAEKCPVCRISIRRNIIHKTGKANNNNFASHLQLGLVQVEAITIITIMNVVRFGAQALCQIHKGLSITALTALDLFLMQTFGAWAAVKKRGCTSGPKMGVLLKYSSRVTRPCLHLFSVCTFSV